MSKKSLSHLSSEATQRTNTTGVMTAILEVDPDPDTIIRFLNQVSTGDESGLPVYAGLLDSTGTQLPTDTEMLFQAQLPGRSKPIPVSVTEDNIRQWNGLTVSEQRNEEHIDQVKVELEDETVNIRDVDTFEVAINSSAQIDWDQDGTEFYFERSAVRELPREG